MVSRGGASFETGRLRHRFFSWRRLLRTSASGREALQWASALRALRPNTPTWFFVILNGHELNKRQMIDSELAFVEQAVHR
jgi:hypothetical protein